MRRLHGLVEALPPLLEPNERVTLLVSPDTRDHFSAATGCSHVELAVPPAPSWRRAWAEARLLPNTLRTLGVDVLDLQSLPLPPRLPCATVVTVHDVRDLTPLRRRPRWLARAALSKALRRADRVITPSAFTARHLAALRPRHAPPIEIVPGGVDPSFFTSAPVPTPSPPYFLHVGHLEVRKNLDLLVRAHADLRELAPSPPRLVFVGEDHGERRRLLALAETLGTSALVDLLDRVDEARLRTLYAGATAVAIPSLHEGFGLPALEALAAGRPVLVADCGALPEVVGRVGHVLPANTPGAWSAALLRTWRQPDPTEVAVQRQDHARTMSWPRAAARLLDVWRAAARRAACGVTHH